MSAYQVVSLSWTCFIIYLFIIVFKLSKPAYGSNLTPDNSNTGVCYMLYPTYNIIRLYRTRSCMRKTHCVDVAKCRYAILVLHGSDNVNWSLGRVPNRPPAYQTAFVCSSRGGVLISTDASPFMQHSSRSGTDLLISSVPHNCCDRSSPPAVAAAICRWMPEFPFEGHTIEVLEASSKKLTNIVCTDRK